MKIIFAGRDNAFNRKMVQEFSVHHEVVCCLFLEPGRVSRKGKRDIIMRRVKKQGLLKTIDQLAFHLFDRLFLRRNEARFWKQRAEYCDSALPLQCPVHQVHNIHDKRWIELCRQLKTDIILATCSKIIFKPELYNIPALGTYIVHEGLTPEYKGLHTPLWALMKKEFQNIGYTILKANNKIDGGEILIQNTYSLGPGENYRTWSWVGHNAIIAGMENICHAFCQLEKSKSFAPINTAGRKSSYYTWMGLSDFIGLYLKNYVLGSSVKQSYVSEQHISRQIEPVDENTVRVSA